MISREVANRDAPGIMRAVELDLSSWVLLLVRICALRAGAAGKLGIGEQEASLENVDACLEPLVDRGGIEAA